MCFSIWGLYCNRTFVLMSTKARNQPDGSSCIILNLVLILILNSEVAIQILKRKKTALRGFPGERFRCKSYSSVWVLPLSSQSPFRACFECCRSWARRGGCRAASRGVAVLGKYSSTLLTNLSLMNMTMFGIKIQSNLLGKFTKGPTKFIGFFLT